MPEVTAARGCPRCGGPMSWSACTRCKVVLSAERIDAREKVLVEGLLAAEEPVTVIVLGVGHDLADQLQGTGVGYKRVVPKAVQDLMSDR